jgi:hypothetical protein
MGGQSSDDPRDIHSGGWDTDMDRNQRVSGATGDEHSDRSIANVAGVDGDKAVTVPIDRAAKKRC